MQGRQCSLVGGGATVLSLSLSHLGRALRLLLLLERGDLHVEVVAGGCWLSDVSSFPHSTDWRAIEVEGPGAALGKGEEVFLSVADVVVDARHSERRLERFFLRRSSCGRRRRRGARSSSSRGRSSTRSVSFFFFSSSSSRGRRLAARAGQQGGEALHGLLMKREKSVERNFLEKKKKNSNHTLSLLLFCFPLFLSLRARPLFSRTSRQRSSRRRR